MCFMQERQLSFMYILPLTSDVYFLVNLFFSNLYVTIILQWIAFIAGKDKEEEQ